MVFTSRTVPWDKAAHSRELLLSREWLVTNGLGGFASGTIAGAVTRRYHGLLIAALPTPHGRTVMWSHVSEFLRFPDDDVVSLGAEERAGGQLDLGAADYLHEFRLENGLPVWTYRVRGIVLEKRVLMLHLQNTVHLIYRILEAETRPRLELRPAFYFRHYESAVNEGLPAPYHLSAIEDRYEVSAAQSELPPLRMKLANDDAQFTVSPQSIHQVFYRVEQSRGYAYEGELWSPGFFVVDMQERDLAAIIASTEAWDIINVLTPETALAAEEERRAKMLDEALPEARSKFAAELVFAGDQFIITPAGRFEEAARAHAAGDEVRTVIAGYHWFTDWGRDTMISLEGLSLVTGRCLEAGYILRTFAHSKHVPGWREGGPLSHRRRDPLVFSRAQSLPTLHRRSNNSASLAAGVNRCRRVPFARHSFQYPCRSAGRFTRAGRGRLSAHLDGREDGRLGGNAASREGS